MSNFFKSKFFIVILIITVLVLVIMAFSTVGREKSPFISNTVGAVVTPVQKLFWESGNMTSGFFRHFKDLGSYKEEYNKLLEQIEVLERETREVYELRNENERLRALLSLKETRQDLNTVGAEIVAKDPGNWYSSFTINKGTKDNISKNDTVITEKGLVGYVYEVGGTWAKVITIIDSKSSVGCIIERTNDRAIVEGDIKLLENGFCKMSYISKGASVIEGDYVETSGLGGIYPKGLLIGKIKQLTPDAQGLYHEAVVEPAVDFERLQEVLIITETYTD